MAGDASGGAQGVAQIGVTPPPVGSPAPDFTLEDTHGAPVSLSGLRGRRVLVVFFPHAFTPTCTGELAAIRDDLHGRTLVGRNDVAVLGVSCDPSPALKVFAEQQGVGFDLLSDFWPHGQVARSYGVFLESRGFATRASFLLDEQGTVRWSVVNGPGEARDTTAYAAALAALG